MDLQRIEACKEFTRTSVVMSDESQAFSRKALMKVLHFCLRLRDF